MIPKEFKKIENNFSAVLDTHKNLQLTDIREMLYPPFIENDQLKRVKKYNENNIQS